MVLSFTNNYLFPRIPKNASTTVAAHFIENAFDSRRDVCTRIPEFDNSKNINFPTEVYHKHIQDWHYVHLTPQEIIDGGIVTADQVRSMNLINIIRDPFERQISLFLWIASTMSGSKDPDTLKKFFRKKIMNGYYKGDGSNMIRQYDYGTVEGEHIAECWLFEEFPQRLRTFCLDRNIPYWTLSHEKSLNIKQHDMSYYDDATYEAVATYFAKDIELYNKLKNSQEVSSGSIIQ